MILRINKLGPIERWRCSIGTNPRCGNMTATEAVLPPEIDFDGTRVDWQENNPHKRVSVTNYVCKDHEKSLSAGFDKFAKSC